MCRSFSLVALKFRVSKVEEKVGDVMNELVHSAGWNEANPIVGV